MSDFGAPEPVCTEHLDSKDTVDLMILPRTADIGGFDVRRVLPSRQRRMVGPFIFWDQMGPGEFLTGQGLDVQPHPHIGLSTLTYLFDGAIMHRDSLGSLQEITAGDVNLMTAGSGVTHSERTDASLRAQPHRLFGLQCWLALPQSQEECAPAFEHHGRNNLPLIDDEGLKMRLVSGTFDGEKSPVQTHHNALFGDAHLQRDACIRIPRDIEERAIYIVSGSIETGGTVYDAGRLLVLKPHIDVTARAVQGNAHIVILGGAAMDGPRYIWWNFVSSSKERLEQAKDDWKNQRFKKIPGDDKEFVPLPAAGG